MRTTRFHHGLELRWGNDFFLYGDDTCQIEARAVVQANLYAFENIIADNVGILTPAQQIMWMPSQEDPFLYVLTPRCRQWLSQNIGAPGVDWYCRDKPFNLMFQCILFRRRQDARQFIAWIEQVLSGISSKKTNFR